MTPIPQYSYAIVAGLDNADDLVNVELLSAGGKYFAPPALFDDDILTQPLSSGEDFERGYEIIVWASKLWRVQYNYIYATLLNNSYSGPVTFRTRRAWSNETFHVYDGYLRISKLQPVQRNYTLYPNFQWTFTRPRFIS